jgi:CDP-diacylglycerol--serine O-phosphatidyltransferase
MLVPILIGIALIADFLDGFAARALNVKSDLGAQLDSLADMITFGVLPAVMLYKVSSFSIAAFYYKPVLIRYPVFIYAMFAALRLAKFNIDKRQEENFLGLATPAAAILITGLYCYMFLGVKLDHTMMRVVYHPDSIVVITLILSYLMTAEIPMFSMKGNPFSWQENKFRLIFLVLSIPQIFLFHWLSMSTIILTYIILSLIQNMMEKKPVSTR